MTLLDTGYRPRRIPRVPNYTRQRRSELGMLLLACAITILAYILASLGQYATIPTNLSWILVAMISFPIIIHVANLYLVPLADPVIMPIVAFLNGLGFVMITRLNHQQALLQGTWTALGVVAYVVTLVVVTRSDLLDRYRFLFALMGLGLLVLPLAPGIGENINGARLWIRVGPISFQPVELAKLALAIFFASYFVEKREVLIGRKGVAGIKDNFNLRVLGPIATAWIASLMIMTLERDVGFSLMLFLVFIITLWIATARLSYLVGGSLLFGVGAIAASKLFGQVNERITIWIDPWKYAETIGYQIVQAQYALGSGGLGGTGLGQGHPTLIPVVTSDFIYAAIGEEMGLLGTTAVLMAFLLLVGAGIRASLRATSPFSSLVTASFTLILGLQSFFIMAGVVRLLPLTGVTLPFVAYGGSSLISNYVLVAVLMRVSNEGNELELVSIDELANPNRPRWSKRPIPAPG